MKRKIAVLLIIIAVSLFVAEPLPWNLNTSGHLVLADNNPRGARQIPAEEFLRSNAAQYFKTGQYHRALEELRTLEKEYPEDPLIQRYLGIVLDKIGRYDDAIATLDAALQKSPDNLALRYSKAQALVHKGNLNEAAKELEYVVQNDETDTYRKWAMQDLETLKKALQKALARKPKKWSFYGTAGANYHTNATLESQVPGYGSQLHQSGWEFFGLASTGYQFAQVGKWFFKFTYSYYQSIYSDSLSQLNTFLNSPGLVATYAGNLFKRPLLLQLGQTTSYAMVRDDYYSTSFIQSLIAVYVPYNWYRITLAERWSVNTFDQEGYEPDVTSRDGPSNLVALSNHFYLNKAKNLYYILTFDYQRDNTQGVDYVRNAYGIQTGFHFPLWLKFEAETLFKFRESRFPKFSPVGTEPERSRDEEYTLEAVLTRKLTPNWSLDGRCKLLLNDSQNDTYTYTDQVIGFSLSYYY